ncbi:F0F1 ATP synthase subunit delta [Rickettsiella massiliensis]|uniref:F0F1 ATP synthase subunit delta n=1 Tax=Rickettsiella massiliensis TaxID=676517 RepID=UPI00029AC801|nr:F0F1 ATP synthase subunit delta [Rickettsiella massiliensis]
MTPQKQLSVARPYAKAVFTQAIEDNQLKAWGILLNQVRLIIEAKPMQALLGDRRIDPQVALACLLEFVNHSYLRKEKIS